MDVTAQLLGGDGKGAALGTQQGPVPGMASDPATGGQQGTQMSGGQQSQEVAAKTVAGTAPADKPALTGNETTVVGAQTGSGVVVPGAADTAIPQTDVSKVEPVAVQEIPLVDRISQDETREKSLEDRVATIETKLNETIDTLGKLTDRVNALPAPDATGGTIADELRADVKALTRRIFGS